MKCMIPVHYFLLTNIPCAFSVQPSTLPLFKCHNYAVMGQKIAVIFVVVLFSLLAIVMVVLISCLLLRQNK